MSTPQEAPELTPFAWENTPVVIKTGGGTTEGEIDPLLMECQIFIQEVPPQHYSFKSNLLGNEWQSAKSKQLASITRVEIFEDGNKTPSKTILPDPPGLAVVQVSYAHETVIVSEVALPDSDQNKRVSISSSRPFGVKTHDAPTTEWEDSKGYVPADKPFVVFTQGHTVERYQCGSTDVEVTIMVEWGRG
jgi:hypothetical protein